MVSRTRSVFKSNLHKDDRHIDVVSYIFEDPKNPKEIIGNSIITVCPNGVGKTTSFVRWCSLPCIRRRFHIIYFLGNSHKTCENIVNKFKALGVRNLIWYQGIQKACVNQDNLKEAFELGLPPSIACETCEYNISNIMSKKALSRFIFKKLSEGILTPTEFVRRSFEFPRGEKIICLHPLIRKMTLSAFRFKTLSTIKKYCGCPIIVAPYQIFTHPTTVAYFLKSAKKRKTRDVLIIFDEGDSLLWNGITFTFPKPEILDSDIAILEQFSYKTVNLTNFLDIYEELFTIFDEFAENKIHLDEFLDRVEMLFSEKNIRVVKAVYRQRRKIAEVLWVEKKRTNIFKFLSVLNPNLIEHIYKNLTGNAIYGIEKNEDGEIVFSNYPLTEFILSSNEYPFKITSKVLLTATFPELTKSFIYGYKIPYSIPVPIENVYYFTFSFFENPFDIVTRNFEIENQAGLYTGKFFILLEKAIGLYREAFKRKPRGVLAFWGNSKQYRAIKNMLVYILQGRGARVEEHEDHIKFTDPELKVPVIMSYFGSRISRSIDLPHYDISLALAPFLRPPRKKMIGLGDYDQIDRARAIAECIQACMRIVRSICPAVPKLIGLEVSFMFKEYADCFPEWFAESIYEDEMKNLGSITLPRGREVVDYLILRVQG
ncbi:hypothetical protein DRN86_05160 [Candidatus Geothermarchaeota archaeon]|nr:MAG: hypothetical protein DRN86_05160 [Candidatus Geothermarchaeota archaeon]